MTPGWRTLGGFFCKAGLTYLTLFGLTQSLEYWISAYLIFYVWRWIKKSKLFCLYQETGTAFTAPHGKNSSRFWLMCRVGGAGTQGTRTQPREPFTGRKQRLSQTLLRFWFRSRRVVTARCANGSHAGAAERVPSQVMGTRGGNPHDSLTILLGLVWLLVCFFFFNVKF